MDGRQFFFLKGKHWENSRKKLDGRQKKCGGGGPKYRPSFYRGGCN